MRRLKISLLARTWAAKATSVTMLAGWTPTGRWVMSWAAMVGMAIHRVMAANTGMAGRRSPQRAVVRRRAQIKRAITLWSLSGAGVGLAALTGRVRQAALSS